VKLVRAASGKSLFNVVIEHAQSFASFSKSFVVFDKISIFIAILRFSRFPSLAVAGTLAKMQKKKIYVSINGCESDDLAECPTGVKRRAFSLQCEIWQR
jgi:hypothetical protein